MVIARRRGIRQPRMCATGRQLETQNMGERNIFDRRTSSKSNSAENGVDEMDQSNLYLENKKSKSKGKGKGGKKATVGQRSRSRSAFGEGRSTAVPLDVPRRNTNFCEANDHGIFGSERGDMNEVEFIYQAEVHDVATTVGQFEMEILPGVEKGILDLVVPHLFGPPCGTFRRLQLGLLPPLEPKYLGISTKPVDRVMSDGKCNS